jgi:PAS domain S-box-containing protein
MKTYSVLIADDDVFVRKILIRICQNLQWTVEDAASGHEVLEKLNQKSYHIFVLDVKMAGPSGLELAQIILQKDPTAAVLILTGFAEIEQAVGSIKKGVFDYVQKDDVENDELEKILLRAAVFHENRITQIRTQEEREQSLKNIERSNQEFQAVLELSRDLIFIVNAKSGEFTDCNKAAYSLLGYSRTELLSLTLKDVIIDFQDINWPQVFQSVREQSPHAVEKQVITKSKQFLHVDLTYAHVCLDTGEYLAVIARDVSDRKKTEQEIERQRQKVEDQAAILKTIIKSMDEGILLADRHGAITEVNSWFINLAQTPEEFLLQQPIDKIIQLITGCEIIYLLNDYKSGVNVDKKCMYTDISDSRFMLTTQPIYKQGEYQGVIVNLVDISDLVSEQKKAEAEIHYNRDMLAHATMDLQTPLEGIIAISSQLSETSLDESQQLLVEMIQEFANSLSHVIPGSNVINQQ